MIVDRYTETESGEVGHYSEDVPQDMTDRLIAERWPVENGRIQIHEVFMGCRCGSGLPGPECRVHPVGEFYPSLD